MVYVKTIKVIQLPKASQRYTIHQASLKKLASDVPQDCKGLFVILTGPYDCENRLCSLKMRYTVKNLFVKDLGVSKEMTITSHSVTNDISVVTVTTSSSSMISSPS